MTSERYLAHCRKVCPEGCGRGIPADKMVASNGTSFVHVVGYKFDRPQFIPCLAPTESEFAEQMAERVGGLEQDCRDTLAMLKRHLETTLKYVPDSDQSGHPHGYSVIQIPDWEAKQKVAWLEQALAPKEHA